MNPISIQTPAFISYSSPVQGRMAGAILVVTDLIVWLEAKVHALHSLTKYVSASCEKITNMINTL